ncbi:MAG: Sir2 family NAD-dependent protein deacetylase [Elusimicrobia bacterium]|nr:Sir2 family NAD-dependent protein deacetylase [Elusimicrobiota bacterium]
MTAAALEAAARLLREARRVLVFTGAGLSTGSGIPDFRGPQGVWTRRKPVYFQEFLASEEARAEHWDYKLEGWEAFKQARPNAAHRALLALERAGRLELLVTQNIDGLHHAAGHAPEKVVELHGTNRLIECLGCGARSDPEPAFEEFRRTRRCPRCACGGLLKAATISFGQPLRAEVLERAFAAARSCDLALAVGSTLSVQPAAGVPLAARKRGAPYVVLNRGETEHDAWATVRLEGDAVELLPALVGV